MDYKKSVDLANNIIQNKKLSKKDSKKIEDSTKDIVKEYNKKIEAAKTSEEKKKLAKEASDKINESLKQSSKIAYDDAKKELSPSIYDQKNETLVIEVDDKSKESNEDSEKINSRALSKEPKVHKKDKNSPHKAKDIAVLILLIAAVSIALIYTLKKREDS